jgi:hypothetical protein
MSRILRSTVAGVALSLTLGAAAASARPADRPTVREPAGIASRVWLLWNTLLGGPPGSRGGHGGLSNLWAKAGSQMDPNGIGVAAVPSAPISPLTDL